MNVRTIVSPIWKSAWPGGESGILRDVEAVVERGLAARGGAPATVWFRADDVGITGRRNADMFAVFRRHNAPLSPALVPWWMSPGRWDALLEQVGGPSPLWGWHQHGYRHANREPEGRKHEFGPSVPYETALDDLTRGRQKLSSICGEQFTPAFTPPWNRCAQATLDALVDAGFVAVSRTPGARPAAPAGLPDFPVLADLHTRRAPDAASDRTALLAHIEQCVATPPLGIMLHHQRMNDRAVAFLDVLVGVLAEHPAIRLATIGELAAEASR